MDSESTLIRLSGLVATMAETKSVNPFTFVESLAELIAELGGDTSSSTFHLFAQDIVRAAIREFEIPVRLALSKKLSSDKRVPREELLTLADDTIEVAWPILETSIALKDTDLIHIALAGSEEHRLAICRRSGVCELVSAAVCAFEEVDVLETLLLNELASISNVTFNGIARVARIYSQLHAPLAKRNDLPRIIAFEMLEWVEASLHVHLGQRIGFSDSELRTLLRDAIQVALISSPLEESIRILLREFTERNAASSDAEFVRVLDGLPKSQRGLKELATSVFLGEQLLVVRKTCRAPMPDGFAYLCRAADTSQAVFGKLCEHFGPLDVETQFEKAGWLLKAKDLYDALNRSQAHGRLSLWLQTA